jgi:hypothetical protein
MRLTDNAPASFLQSFEDGPVFNEVVQQLSESNALSKPGTDSYKSHGYWQGAEIRLDKNFCDAVYARSMIARRAVDLLPTRALRLFRSWEGEQALPKADKEIVKALFKVYEKQLKRPFLDAAIMGRMYGDGYVVMFWDDVDPNDHNGMAKPIDYRKAKNLLGATAKSCHYLTPVDGFGPESARKFHLSINTQAMTEAERDEYTRSGKRAYRQVHASRVIHIPGLMAPMDLRVDRLGQNMSVLEYLDEPLTEWQSGKYSAIDMLKTHSLFKLAMSNLAVKSMAGAVGELVNRFKTILNGMKYLGSVVLDKNQEEAEFVSRSYSGVDKLIDSIDGFLSTSSDIPKAFLLNDGNAFAGEQGLGARYELAALIQDYIASHLTPALNKFAETWFAANAPGKMALFTDLSPVFNDALMQTRHEKAEVLFKLAQSDVQWNGIGAINLESIRTRWEDGTFNDELVLKGKQISTQEKMTTEAPQGPNTEELARNAATSSRGRYTTPGATKKKDQKETRKTEAGQNRGAGQKSPK